MLENLVKIFKVNLPIMIIFIAFYFGLGGLVMAKNLSTAYLVLIYIVFGLMAVMFDSHFDLYKTNKYKSGFFVSICLSGVLLLIVSMIIVALGIDVNQFAGFKSFSFYFFILIGGYIISILIKEIRYFFEKNKRA